MVAWTICSRLFPVTDGRLGDPIIFIVTGLLLQRRRGPIVSEGAGLSLIHFLFSMGAKFPLPCFVFFIFNPGRGPKDYRPFPCRSIRISLTTPLHLLSMFTFYPSLFYPGLQRKIRNGLPHGLKTTQWRSLAGCRRVGFGFIFHKLKAVYLLFFISKNRNRRGSQTFRDALWFPKHCKNQCPALMT